jgi:hypothetical protein
MIKRAIATILKTLPSVRGVVLFHIPKLHILLLCGPVVHSHYIRASEHSSSPARFLDAQHALTVFNHMDGGGPCSATPQAGNTASDTTGTFF